MVELKGKYNTCKIFTDNFDQSTVGQLTALLNQESIKDSKIRIMSDCHAGKGCVVGTTMTIKDKVVPNLVGVDIGCFTGDTEVWCSAGFYKPIKELAEEIGETKKAVLVDSFNLESKGFTTEKAIAFKTRENADLVAVTYHNEQHAVTIRCTPDHKFLCCSESELIDTSYKSHTLYWKEAKDLKAGDRLVAEDSNVFVADVTALDEKEDVYCLNVEENHNFAIKYGVIVHNCGMHAIKLEEDNIDLEKLDNIINEYVPCGFDIHDTAKAKSNADQIIAPIDYEKSQRSLGSLGGGNHFIEVDKDSNGNLWLVIHTGSRHLGIEVCEHYQNIGYEKLKEKTAGGDIKALRKELIDRLTKEGKQKEISKELKKLNDAYKKANPDIPYELAYVEGEDFTNYLHDMELAQEHAKINRETIAKIILEKAKLHEIERFDTIHNYIDTKNMILRKGSISAQKGEKVLIPMNMRDGSLICVGKGNPDWNYSAPHGAGRIMSRSEAKNNVSMSQFRRAMVDVYSTSVCSSTIDEAPQVYKPMQEIIDNIQDTVDIIDIIKPIYNFKAH